MEKESYSIDDILSEVKRRRESENREQANTEAQVSAQTYKQAEPEKNIEAEPKLKDDIKVQQPEVKVSVAEDKPTKTEVFIEKEENTAKGDTADIVIPTIEEEKTVLPIPMRLRKTKVLHQSINRKPSRRKITVWLTFFPLQAEK